jgi:hypothetical protein
MYGSIPKSCLDKIYEFTRCQRADGSYYGTSGKCRKGRETGAKIEVPTSLTLKTGSETGSKPKTKAALAKEEKLKKALESLIEQRQQLSNRDHLTGVLAANKQILQVLDKIEETPETQKLRDRLQQEGDVILAKIKRKEKEQEIRDNRQREADVSYDEKAMLRRYTSGEEGQYSYESSYEYINKCLRSPDQCRDRSRAEPYIKLMDGILSKLPKNQEGHEFYRGVSVNSPSKEKLFKQLLEATPGTVIRDSGFGSYSAEKRVALGFNSPREKNILFVSRNKNLTPVNVFSEIPSEQEAILPRELDQRITKVTLEGNTLIVELE